MEHEPCNRWALACSVVLLCACAVQAAMASEAYRPIAATMAGKTILLTGHDLTIEQVIDIARHGARVAISEEAMQRGADSFGLMMEAQHEGIAVYRFNRLAGSGREIETLTGDPDTAENTAKLAAKPRSFSAYRRLSARFGPLTATSMAVGAPKLITRLTMSLGSNEKRTPGNS